MSNDDGFPAYRRRSPEQGGNSFIRRKGDEETVITNEWVVPYSPLLSRLFETHLNVEVCSSVKAIKYICKYVNHIQI